MTEDGILLPDGTIFRPGEGGQNLLLEFAAGPTDGKNHVLNLLRLAELAVGQASERGVEVGSGRYHFEPGLDRIGDGLMYLQPAVRAATKATGGGQAARRLRRWAARHFIVAAAELWGAERSQPEELKALVKRFTEELAADA